MQSLAWTLSRALNQELKTDLIKKLLKTLPEIKATGCFTEWLSVFSKLKCTLVAESMKQICLTLWDVKGIQSLLQVLSSESENSLFFMVKHGFK